jgi:predicted dehydrogenase
MPPTIEPIRIGLVGLGTFGQFAADAYAAMPEVRIAGIVLRDHVKRARYASKWGVRGYETIEALLDAPNIDCVVISTPPHLHSSQGLQAVQAGKHVFMETPLATEVEDGDELLSAAQEHRVKVGVDSAMPYCDLHGLLLSIVASGIFRRVTSIMLENCASVEGLEDDHWFWDRAQSGGIFVEHGVHFFDLGARLASSRVESVIGFASSEIDGKEDRVLAALQYANGAHATYYHAFDRPTVLASTELHTIFERGSIHSHGWIPTRMTIEGYTPPDTLPQLSEMIGGALTIKEAIPAAAVQGSASELIVSAEVTRASRDEEHWKAIQRCMADFVHGVRDIAWTPQVTADDAYKSLRVAIAARTSAEQL